MRRTSVFLKTAISALEFMEHVPRTGAERQLLTHCKNFREDLLKRFASSSNTDVEVQDGERCTTDDGRDDNDVRDLPNFNGKKNINLCCYFQDLLCP